MGQYTNADGSTVQFTDPDLIRSATDLYTILHAELPTGDTNLENDQVRQMLTDMRAGKPLDVAQHGVLRQLLAKYADDLAELQATSDKRGQDYFNVPDDSQGRVSRGDAR